ncbi:ABC transporter ATP-binding protein [Paenibacillus wenxiniae]|uniref:ABC transporter ATP-binding protein n=1 Tax=Paenibacillus wenxiniae TaxID=1636843 RepID=A0ABW4RE50_9BACL
MTASSSTAAISEPAILLKDVHYVHEGSSQPAIQGLSLTVLAGEWVAIIGASGSGKSTVCRLINGQLPRLAGGQRDGLVHVHGFDPAFAPPGELVDVLGTLGQDPDAELVVGTVEDELAFGPENLRLPAAEIGARIDRLTDELELEHVRSQAVHCLSGGQRQRTALGAVLAMEPELLVLDEPAASLDPLGRQRVASMIQRWHRKGRTLVTASARWDELADAADRMIIIDAGKVLLDGQPAAVKQEHRALLEQLFILPSESVSSIEESVEDRTEGLAKEMPEEWGTATTYRSAQQTVADCARVPHTDHTERTEESISPVIKRSARSADAKHQSAVVEIKQLSYTYPGTAMPALRDIHLQLFAGEMTLLCGANGSGKTTLTRLLSGLLQPSAGMIYRGTHDTYKDKLDKRARDTAYLFQHPDHQWIAATVWEECCFGLRAELGLRRHEALPETYYPQVERILKRIGLLEQRDASPYSLSGGQKRLLAAAAQFLLDRPLYILDEPGSAADYFTITCLLELCRDAIQRGASLLVVTHEPELFRRDASRICTLEQGQMSVSLL